MNNGNVAGYTKLLLILTFAIPIVLGDDHGVGTTLESAPMTEEERRIQDIKFQKLPPLERRYGDLNDAFTATLIGRPSLYSSPQAYIDQTQASLDLLHSSGLFGLADQIDALKHSVGLPSDFRGLLQKRKQRLQDDLTTANAELAKQAREQAETAAKEQELAALKKANEADVKQDDFWSGAEKSTDKSQTLDEFWNGLPDAQKNHQAPAQDDFWHGGGQEQQVSNDQTDDFWNGGVDVAEQTQGADDVFWNGTGSADQDSALEDQFEIKREDYGINYGVVSSTGQVLIPYQFAAVISYKEGLAHVRSQENRYAGGEGCSSQQYSVYTYQEGIVDSSGDWVIEPANKYRSSVGASDHGLYLVATPAGSSVLDQELARERIKRNRRRCREELKLKVQKIAAQLEAKGYSK